MTNPPRPHEAIGALEQAMADLRHVLAPVELHGRKPAPRITRALDLARETTYGPSSANLDPTTGSDGGDVTLTPTEAAAASRLSPDLHLELRRRIHDAVVTVAALRYEVVSYTGPAEAQAGTQRRPITDTDDACELFALVGVYAPADRTTDVNGNLAKPMRMSRAVYDRIRTTGRQPTKAELRHHVDTGKWPKLHVTPSRTAS